MKQESTSFLEDLNLRLAMLEEGKLDQEFTWSGEGWDWFRKTLEQVLRTNDEDKLRAMREVYINGLTPKYSRSALKDIVLQRLGEMSGAHVAVLRAISQLEELPREPGIEEQFASAQDIHTLVPKLSDVEVAAVISDLYGTGLVYYPPAAVPISLAMSVAHLPRGEHARLSAYGRAFIAFSREADRTSHGTVGRKHPRRTPPA